MWCDAAQSVGVVEWTDAKAGGWAWRHAGRSRVSALGGASSSGVCERAGRDVSRYGDGDYAVGPDRAGRGA